MSCKTKILPDRRNLPNKISYKFRPRKPQRARQKKNTEKYKLYTHFTNIIKSFNYSKIKIKLKKFKKLNKLRFKYL